MCLAFGLGIGWLIRPLISGVLLNVGTSSYTLDEQHCLNLMSDHRINPQEFHHVVHL